ncbi:hypothetical protein PC114_g15364 [Phytophthora cactorum]|nr:hypothetical protein PC114_g15364 [Phytophthora cactorum]KAG3176830.1 hypothetical protein PC128_g17114 [Phytophthora cactorum]
MTNANDKVVWDDAPATTQALVTNRERDGMVNDIEEESNAVPRKGQQQQPRRPRCRRRGQRYRTTEPHACLPGDSRSRSQD